MAVRLARHARRQLRLARDRRRLLPQSDDPVVSPREQPCPETSRLAEVIVHLTLKIIRFHEIYMLINLGCLVAFWLPSTVNSSFRRSLKSAGSVAHLVSSSNTTKPSSFETSSPLFGFIDESAVQIFIACGYIAVAILTVPPHLIQLHLPYIETISHGRLFFIFRRFVIRLIISPIIGQLVSGFADRPLDMLVAFPPNSLLIVQIIGFLLCLFSSFIFGVIYASVQQSKPPSGTF